MFTRPLRLKARPPRWTNTAQKYRSGFHNNTTWSRQMLHCTYLLSKLSLVWKSALSQFSSRIFLDARQTPGITNWGGKKRRSEKGIWWSMVTKHGWQIFFCLSVSPTLLSSPDRVGPNSRWCRREARTWDLQIFGSLTSAQDKHGGATNPKFEKVSVVFDHHIFVTIVDYCRVLYMLYINFKL